ncbi:MAG: glycosyltransferase family 39 protein [Alphaproteobacteria bacterium]|nr:glycosyltransferase family 39 protein [Kordiimonadaceae bacterium]MBO6629630.1 glycosyltransferase family 39 protein [Alphaproteobacteria bacterium]
MITIVGLIVTFVVAPIGAAMCAGRLKYNNKDHLAIAVVCAMGMAPALIAIMLWWLFQVLPFQSDRFYLMAISLTVAGTVGVEIATRNPATMRAINLAWRKRKKSFDGVNVILFLLAGLSAALVLFQVFSFPMWMNDSQEYFLVAKHIYANKTMEVYPVNQSTLFGLYANITHPPGYNMMLVWGMLYAGDESTLPARVIAAFYFILTIALLWFTLSSHAPRARMFSILCLIGAPLYVSHVAGAHTDAQRVFLFLAALSFLPTIVKNPGLGSKVLLSLMVSASIFSHSTGVLALPFVLGAFFALAEGPYRQKITSSLQICVFSTLVGGGQYIRNFLTFGKPISDHEPLLDNPAFDYNFTLSVDRALETPANLIFNGLLGGFSYVQYHGFAFWLGMAGMVLMFAKYRKLPLREQNPLHATFFFTLVGYHILTIATASLGILLMIKNQRYNLTILPLYAFFGGIFLEALYAKFQR